MKMKVDFYRRVKRGKSDEMAPHVNHMESVNWKDHGMTDETQHWQGNGKREGSNNGGIENWIKAAINMGDQAAGLLGFYI